MSDQQRLIDALRAADAAGDTEAATKFAQAIRQGQAATLAPQQQPTQQPAPQAPAQPLAPGPYTQRAPDGRMITRPPTAQESKPMDWAAAGNAGAAGMVDMATFNQGNKLDAYLQSKTGIGGAKGDYEGNLARTSAARDAAEAKDPGAYAVGGAVGAYANPVNRAIGAGADKLIAAGPQSGLLGAATRYGTRMGQGGLIGAGYGGGFAPPGQAGEGAIKGAIGGAATAGAMQLGADVAAPVLSRMAGAATGETADAAALQQKFKDSAQKGYKAAEDSGVVISPQSFGKFAQELPTQLKGYHPAVTKEAASIVQMLQDEASTGPMTLEKLDALRSVASEASADSNLRVARLAGHITGKIDEFVDGLRGADLVAGDAAAAEKAAGALTQARSDWRTYSKLRTINDIVDTGEMLNDQNWVKGRFRALVKSNQFDRFTPDEQKAIANVARTGNMEKVIKLLPWRGLQMASTYAEPMMQDAKVSSLQGLIAKGGRKPSPGAIFGSSSPPSLFNAYGGLAAAQVGQRRQANGR
jgi:hypothetical protein